MALARLISFTARTLSWGRPISLLTALRGLGQHEVGHEGVVTRRDVFSLRSSLDANPQGVAQPSLQSTINSFTLNINKESINLKPLFL